MNVKLSVGNTLFERVMEEHGLKATATVRDLHISRHW